MNARAKMHQRNALRVIAGPVSALLKNTPIAESDVDKIFVINTDRTSGTLMSRELFNMMDISKIGGWIKIRTSDVNLR